jgi:MFS transporter, UMF1 family
VSEWTHGAFTVLIFFRLDVTPGLVQLPLPNLPMQEQRRAIWSWALIDWANSAFAMVMLSVIFPIILKTYWCDVPGMTSERSTLIWALANGIASGVIAVLAPLLGSIADQGNSKKRFLIGFTLLGCLATSLLPLIAQGHYLIAASLYVFASIGFSGNTMFSDALLTDVAEPRNYDRVSAFGYGLGYLGGGGMFAFCTWVLASPETFGLAGKVAAAKFTFLLTAGWWIVFTIPCVLWIHETPGAPNVGQGSPLTRGFRQLATTFKDIRKNRSLLFFLLGYVLYIDGVNTVIKMAGDFALAIGLDGSAVIKAFLVVQFVAFPAAIAFGRLGEKIGPKRGIMLGVIVYAGVCIFATQLSNATEFFGLAVVIGLVQGGVQSLSRSYFARLIPAEKGGEYFGFYNMVGKFSAIIGPPLMGVTGMLTDSRTSILSLLLLFAGGMWFLGKVGADSPAISRKSS